MFQGIEHTAIASPAPKELAEWYERNLDFRINYSYDGNYFVRAANGTMLEIIPAQGDRGTPAMRTPGIRHIAIAVDDFDASLDALKERKIPLLAEPYENAGNRLVFFSDPDGNILHLIHRASPLP